MKSTCFAKYHSGDVGDSRGGGRQMFGLVKDEAAKQLILEQVHDVTLVLPAV